MRAVKYFEYVQRHPRTLVGEQVPSMTGDGMEVLRDSADAKDWQDAVKEQLKLALREQLEIKAYRQEGWEPTAEPLQLGFPREPE